MFAKARDQDGPEEREDLNRSLSAPSPMLHRHPVPWPAALETGPEAGHRPQKHQALEEGPPSPRFRAPSPPAFSGRLPDGPPEPRHPWRSWLLVRGDWDVSKQRRLPRGPEPWNELGEQGISRVLLLLSCSTLCVPRGD